MSLRCFKFYLRGMLWLRPVPYHGDYRCWARGSFTTASVIALFIPVAIFAAGFMTGIILGR